MSKELEALEILRNTLLAEGYWQDILQDVSIIESALKRLEEKEHNLKVEMKVNSGLMKRLAKQNQVLKIIKEHRLDIDWFLQFVEQDISYKNYVYYYRNYFYNI